MEPTGKYTCHDCGNETRTSEKEYQYCVKCGSRMVYIPDELPEPVMAKIRAEYPFASLDRKALIAEAQESLPFGAIGAGGGYGPIRANLRDAILVGDWKLAEFHYYELHADGLLDALIEGNINDLNEGLEETFAYMDAFGNISDFPREK